MSKKMNDAARKARNAYMKEWRKANPDKVKANSERYWEKQAAKLAGEREDEQ